MSKYVISTDEITATIDSMGAELISVKRTDNDREYIWCADSKYWKRHSPVLFPIVGRYKNDKCQYKGKEYTLTQHGFARDKEFELITKDDKEIWFLIESDENTLEKYPFKFKLECGYKVIKNSLEVMWKVTNQDTKKMYFSLGAHPAFAPPVGDADMTNCSLQFDTEKTSIEYSLLSEEVLLLENKYSLSLNHKCAAITSEMFDQDAFVIEDNQAHTVSLVDGNGSPFVTVDFNAPLFGIWSPVKCNVPFVCIEPWYGRCDRADFEGCLEEREWGNTLDVDQIFEANYTMRFK